MQLRSSCLRAVLALSVTITFLSTAGAQVKQSKQAKAPERTAQRGTAPGAQQTADGRATNTAPRGTAETPPRAGGRPAATPGQPSAAKVVAPAAPFELTEAQQQLLNQILDKWEKESDKIKTFKCAFDRWETDKTFGPKQLDYVISKGGGNISYVKPDRGAYQIKELNEWDPKKNALVKKTEGFDHWVCDGAQIFEYDYRNKRLIVRDLPPEMRGKAISDGPLPFVFGAKADALKLRYWMKDVTPREQVGKEVWLESWPKRQQDKANFHHATLILTDPDFKPFALQIYMPDGKNHTDYAFKDSITNDPLAVIKGDFMPPFTPPWWKRVVNPEASDGPTDGAEKPAAPPTVPAQAKRPTAPTKRK